MATRYSISTIPFQSDREKSFEFREVSWWIAKNGYNWPLTAEEKDKAMVELVNEFGIEVLDVYSASKII